MIAFVDLHDRLLQAHGSQQWWPASDPFEIMLGAVLVQRTTWRNAELAIVELARAKRIDPAKLAQCRTEELEASIRSAGFFRIKARRLRDLANFVLNSGGIEALSRQSTVDLRLALLSVHGIGPETADTVLLYAFDRPVVVIDEYLRRLMRRLEPGVPPVGDEALRQLVLAEIHDSPRLNELHALVVEHGKRICTRNPRCEQCVLEPWCGFSRERSDS